jgi:hypothetical protein
MKHLILLLFLSTLVISCKQDLDTPCSAIAVVRDLTGLDGCGYLFELEDGTRLIPVVQFYCGTPPIPKEMKEDPLYNFDYVDGKKVSISYEQVHAQANICMAGTMVKITCLSELQAYPAE